MNKELIAQSQLFNFEGNDFTVILINDEPHWIAKEICDYLELSNPSVSLKNLKDGTQKKYIDGEILRMLKEDTKLNLGCSARINLLTEAGVYKLVFKSRKPNAEDFTDWISEEVLPKIRNTGKFDSIENKINKIQDEKERELTLGLYSLEQALKVNQNDLSLPIMINQKKLELNNYKQQEQLKQLNSKIIEIENKSNEQENRLNNMLSIGDRVQFTNEVNRISRLTGKQQSEIYNLAYIKLKDMYGIDLNTRVKNRREQIQDKRLSKDKKPYAPSTLKSKINNLVLADELNIWNELGNSLNAVNDEFKLIHIHNKIKNK